MFSFGHWTFKSINYLTNLDLHNFSFLSQRSRQCSGYRMKCIEQNLWYCKTLARTFTFHDTHAYTGTGCGQRITNVNPLLMWGFRLQLSGYDTFMFLELSDIVN